MNEGRVSNRSAGQMIARFCYLERIAGGGEVCQGPGPNGESETSRPRRFRVAAGPGLPARIIRGGLAAKRRAGPAAVPLKGRKPHRFRPSTLAVMALARPSVALGGDGRGTGSGLNQPIPFGDAAEPAFIRSNNLRRAARIEKLIVATAPCSSSRTKLPSLQGKSTSIWFRGGGLGVNMRRVRRLRKFFFFAPRRSDFRHEKNESPASTDARS